MTMLGIPFDDRLKEPFTAPSNYDEFRAFSPTGQVPVLIDETKEGWSRTIYDSLGITLYLADRHEGVWPADEAARCLDAMRGDRNARRLFCAPQRLHM